MTSLRITRRLLDAGWCVLVPLGVTVAYLGVGVVSVIQEPILSTVLVDGALIVIVGALRLLRPRWLAYAPGPRPASGTPRFGRTVAGCAVLAFLAGQSLALWLYTMGGSAGFDASIQYRQDAGAVLTLLLALAVAPVAEEMLFRGLLYPLLRKRLGTTVSVLVTTAVFGLVHGNIVQFASALPLAVLLALVFERTRRLWPCVLLHLGFNLAATVIPAPALSGLANPVSGLLLNMAFAGCALTLCRKITGTSSPVCVDGPGADGQGEESEVDVPRSM
ncbi:lysostaphin resistance A-like protein [Streptomyces sp. NPDC056061]|uniref:CPBP family intramembrane glutamic endopeptidase n=1 Tax=Streptomyces sp. NPDC056061 TaxID=3345700 RepID=UPI0035DAF9F4